MCPGEGYSPGCLSKLKDTLIGYELPAWNRSRRRKAIETARFHIFDVGVARALRKLPPLVQRSTDLGDALEHFPFSRIENVDRHPPPSSIPTTRPLVEMEQGERMNPPRFARRPPFWARQYRRCRGRWGARDQRGAPSLRPQQRPYSLARGAGEAADRRAAGEGPRAGKAACVPEALSPTTATRSVHLPQSFGRCPRRSVLERSFGVT